MGGPSQDAAGGARASAKEDRSVLLGSLLATIYAERLPESRATLARARDNNDLVRLMASKQLDVALMREREAHAALVGASWMQPS